MIFSSNIFFSLCKKYSYLGRGYYFFLIFIYYKVGLIWMGSLLERSEPKFHWDGVSALTTRVSGFKSFCSKYTLVNIGPHVLIPHFLEMRKLRHWEQPGDSFTVPELSCGGGNRTHKLALTGPRGQLPFPPLPPHAVAPMLPALPEDMALPQVLVESVKTPTPYSKAVPAQQQDL